MKELLHILDLPEDGGNLKAIALSGCNLTASSGIRIRIRKGEDGHCVGIEFFNPRSDLFDAELEFPDCIALEHIPVATVSTQVIALAIVYNERPEQIAWDIFSAIANQTGAVNIRTEMVDEKLYFAISISLGKYASSVTAAISTLLPFLYLT